MKGKVEDKLAAGIQPGVVTDTELIEVAMDKVGIWICIFLAGVGNVIGRNSEVRERGMGKTGFITGGRKGVGVGG